MEGRCKRTKGGEEEEEEEDEEFGNKRGKVVNARLAVNPRCNMQVSVSRTVILEAVAWLCFQILSRRELCRARRVR